MVNTINVTYAWHVMEKLGVVLGRVVRKPISANPGLKVNQRSNFSGIKTFFATNVLCSLRLFQLKTEGQTILYINRLKTSLKSYKTEIKILADPGLA